MGFLDNLEDSLKNLEAREERDPAAEQRQAEERVRSAAAAPWSAKLKSSEFTKQLLDKAAIAGHRIRTKIYMAWLENTLRLEARERRLELKPTEHGVVAQFTEPDGTATSMPLDLESDPQALLDQWLQSSSATTGERQ